MYTKIQNGMAATRLSNTMTVYYDDKQRANPSKIKDLQFQLCTLLQFPMKYEKQFKEQQERAAEVQAL